jgi:hypothetical protein
MEIKLKNIRKTIYLIIMIEIIIFMIMSVIKFEKINNKQIELENRIRQIEILGDFYD